jgi:radical SAM superfamily enzyme YgiQ (UPF0313 family)
MSWKIIEAYRRLLAAEQGAVCKNPGGKLTVCLVYPNHYRTAMSNLGFQAVYAMLNGYPDVVCERAFLPEPDEAREYARSRTPLLSLESQRPVADFDIIAFSVSFESDYLHIPAIFAAADIPVFAAGRNERHPLVMAGGAALFLNPEPVADFMDLICLGEAEAILEPLLDLFRSEEGVTRPELLRAASALPGVYVPGGYRVTHEGVRQVSRTHEAWALASVERRWAEDLDSHATVSGLLTSATEFGDMYLVEISRGCPRGCRFCAAGFIYLPYRRRSLETLKDAVLKGVELRGKVGLVGAAVSDYPEIDQLCREIVEHGGKVSVSSLRIDAIDEEMIGLLKASGHKTVALAPEGGSQRLRDLIRKGIDEQQILAACDRLIGRDILNLKLYFIIGLPTETEADLEEMVHLVARIRERVVAAARGNRRLGEIILSVNPFVPKPFTPFQWCGMEDMKSLDNKGRFLRQAVGKMANVRLLMESPKDASLQALLSRGDRRLAPLLVAAHESGNWRRAAKSLGIDTDAYAQRSIPLEEQLPWDFIDHDKARLVTEYRRAFPGGEELPDAAGRENISPD